MDGHLEGLCVCCLAENIFWKLAWHLVLVIFGGTTFEYMWMIANLGHSWYIPFFFPLLVLIFLLLSLWHTICMGNGVGNGIWMGFR